MNEFWLWFWRPIAEFLGVIAFAVAFFAAVFVGFVLWMCWLALVEKWRKFRRPIDTTAKSNG